MPPVAANIKWKKNVYKDIIDFRDKMYVPTLVEVPPVLPLENYLKYTIPVLDQEQTNACTGFALTTVAHYLFKRRKILPAAEKLSPFMIYGLARRYDEFPEADDSGSTARAGMKAWHKHGICLLSRWKAEHDGNYSFDIAEDAASRPLGAYYRVNHKDIVAMHCALTEVGILYVSAGIGSGWNDENIGKDGMIKENGKDPGGHAFVIVGYDEKGFWLQNSYGTAWGKKGFAHFSYDDWLKNGWDCWVARLGAPVQLKDKTSGTAYSFSVVGSAQNANNYLEYRPHIISLENNGFLKNEGTYANDESTVENILTEFIETTKSWKRKRILLYAHGGLVAEETALQRLADYKNVLLKNEVYPLFFIWHSGAWDTIKNIFEDTLQKRAGGALDKISDFMLDRIDDGIEVLVRKPGRKLWDEMKENAVMASQPVIGGATITLGKLNTLMADPKNQNIEIHIAAHSAGSIFMAPVIKNLTENKRTINSCTLWAPACTFDDFKNYYLPAIRNITLENFSLFTLTDKAEQDDNCGRVYNKSLLYLVRNSFEEKNVKTKKKKNILGMEVCINEEIKRDASLAKVFNQKTNWVLSPNLLHGIPGMYSTASCHSDFDDNNDCLKSTLERILGKPPGKMNFNFHRSAAGMQDQKNVLKNYIADKKL